MIVRQYCLAAICLLCALKSTPSHAEQYRIASQEDFDHLNTATFQPGDLILFKRGVNFIGMFSPSGKGSVKAPIRIDAYGQGERPRIDAAGRKKAALLLRNPSFWEVSGLEITNSDGTDDDQGELFGIYVLAEGEEGTYEHVYISDCHIHDVNGKVAGKRRGGIHVHIKKLKKSIFHDLRITNNRIVRIGGVGIGNSSSCGKVEFRKHDTVAHYLWTKVYVADNYVDHTGRNNIIARVSNDAVYERNTLANSSRYSTGHSIFCFNTDGIKIQFNEAYGNVGEGGKDRGGFDADYNCVNTFIQYNYSHDNLWFCGIMKKKNRNVVIRYNVSQNDKEGIYFYGFEKNRQAHNIHIYNNTHYVKKGLNVSVFAEGRTPLNSRFENNIFFFEGKGKWGKNAKGINTVFTNNLYFNITPHNSDSKPKTEDPGFLNAGQAGTGIDLKTMEALCGYRPRLGSTLINGGIEISNNGGWNLLKAEVKTDGQGIGAF
mgnify:FL=1|jgi:hypothetical protein|tara:strand:- start:500 stop:1960 length:1461 start_codon:yes stop_codon:yes gene_type:complete